MMAGFHWSLFEGGANTGCDSELGTRFCLLEESGAEGADGLSCCGDALASGSASVLSSTLGWLVDVERSGSAALSSSLVCAASSEEQNTRQIAQISRSDARLRASPHKGENTPKPRTRNLEYAVSEPGLPHYDPETKKAEACGVRLNHLGSAFPYSALMFARNSPLDRVLPSLSIRSSIASTGDSGFSTFRSTQMRDKSSLGISSSSLRVPER